MKIEKLHQLFQESTGITTDSRNIISGNIFLALSGENFNGNVFAKDALEKGCSYAIIDDDNFAHSPQYIVVDNCLKTLQGLAAYHRQTMDIPVIAITGTNGKTTTKELISCVLNSEYKIISTIGNLNNHIGVPFTLLRIDKTTQIAVIEMGANHPGEISLLCNIAKPNFGLITNIGKAHLEGFGGFEGVIGTKNELYQHLSNAKGTIFYNSDNKILTGLLSNNQAIKIAYGNSSNNFCNGETINADPYLQFKISDCDQIQTKLAGAYNFENALAAVCIGKYFKIPLSGIKNSLENYTPENQRSQIKKTDHNRLIMDFYNANPSSMEAALENFNKMTYPNKTVILGDMLELGTDSESEHVKIFNIIRNMDLQQVLLVGANFNSLKKEENYICFERAEQMKNWLKEHPIKDCLILIKGSRGIKLETVVDVL
jgi:UDP-N-acetylmuramoyl-tripeptide--D-alanyl-D-alanine ligase